jgi:ubiquinone/menaquinone biosynthesis C-methylase UbiE
MIRQMLQQPAVFHRLNAVLDRFNDANLRCLRRALAPSPTGWILDIGCGTGRYAGDWRARYVGVDTDASYLCFAANRYGGRFVRGDGARLPIRDGSFDAAYCVGVLHHLDDDQVGGMAMEMMRVCRSGGTVALLEPLAPESGDGWVRTALARLERGAHLRHFDTLTALLRRSMGPALQVWCERTHPFDLGLYWVRAERAAGA